MDIDIVYCNDSRCKVSFGVITGWRGGRGDECQSCNEDSLKIMGRAMIHDFVATFGVNDRPIYMVLCS